MKAKDIICFAQSLKAGLRTSDPFQIARYYGIPVLMRPSAIKEFKAMTIRTAGSAPIISINSRYSGLSARLLCAHELGHALFHEDCINHFAVTAKNINTNVEYEANLFALALLLTEEQMSSVSVPLDKLDNYVLKSIIENNLI